MMELPLIIYAIEVLPQLANVLSGIGMAIGGILGAICIAYFAFWFATYLEGDHKEVESVKSIGKKALPLVLKLSALVALLAIINALTPSTNGLYKILAAYGVQHVAENERVQTLAGESLSLLERAIKDYSEELDKKGKGDE